MLQKLGCCTPNPPPPKKSRPLLHVRALTKKFKKESKFFFYKKPQKNLCTQLSWQRPVAGRRPLIVAVAGRRGRSAKGDRWSGSSRRLPTAPTRVPFLVFPLPPSSYFLPPKFCTCGQLFLIGSSTCPPCPDFSY
jgi:hypothetical protein